MAKKTQKEKLEQFDALEADRDTMRLVLYDVLNGKFSKPVRIDAREYDSLSVEGSYLEMSRSERAMPLYLINWRSPESNQRHSAMFMTENEIMDMGRDYMSAHQRMIQRAHYLLNLAKS
jgi:hypothetical protein